MTDLPSVQRVAWAVCRVAPLIALPPLRLIPGAGALVVLFTALVLIPAQAPAELGPMALGAGLFHELLIGATLALGAAVPCAAAAAAGAQLDGLLVEGRPWTGRPAAGATRLWGWLALSIFAALSGPQRVLAALAQSYQVLPPALPGTSPGIDGPIALAAQLLVLSARLAAPALLSVLLAQVALALLLRIAGPGQPGSLSGAGFDSMSILRPGAGAAQALRPLLWLLALLLLVSALPTMLRDGLDQALRLPLRPR